MNKSQTTGMYIVLAIVIILFASSVFLSEPAVKIQEISYSNFIEKLNNDEFQTVEKADDFLIATPKAQPKAQEEKTVKTLAPSAENPFGTIEKKPQTIKYKVLIPAFDPDLMHRLSESKADVKVTRATDSSKLLGNALSYLLLPILFIVFLAVMAKSIQAGGSQAMSFGKSKAKMLLDSKVKKPSKMLQVLMKRKKNLKKSLTS